MISMIYILLGFTFLVITAVWSLVHQYLITIRTHPDYYRPKIFKRTLIIHLVLIIAGLFFFLSGYMVQTPSQCPNWKQAPTIECSKKYPAKCWIKFEI